MLAALLVATSMSSLAFSPAAHGVEKAGVRVAAANLRATSSESISAAGPASSSERDRSPGPAPTGRRAGTWSKGYAVIKTAASVPGGRLPELLMTLWPENFASVSSARRACRRSVVLVDGAVGHNGCEVPAGSQIELLARLAAPSASEGRRGALPVNIEPLSVVLDSPSWAVVYKPAGMPTAGGDGLRTTMREVLALSMVCHDAPTIEEPLWRPQHCHRLDAGTCGLLVVAKTRRALTHLSAAFANREVHKRYRALVAGDPAPEASVGAASELRRIELALSGQVARTDWRIISRHQSARWGYVCLVECFPHTGRTHQIRRHLASLGTPIIGDSKYWISSLPEHRGTRLFLCAVGLQLPHPVTGDPVEISVDQPSEFATYCAQAAHVGGSASTSPDDE